MKVYLILIGIGILLILAAIAVILFLRNIGSISENTSESYNDIIFDEYESKKPIELMDFAGSIKTKML